MWLILAGPGLPNPGLADPGICNEDGIYYQSITLANQELSLFCDTGKVLVQKMSYPDSDFFDVLKEDYEKGLNGSENYMISLDALHILTSSYGFNNLFIYTDGGSRQFSNFIIGDKVSVMVNFRYSGD